jgi:hypothetical protein
MCKCKEKPKVNIMDEYTLVRYVGDQAGYYQGQTSKTVYGYRKPLQQFYVMKEDANAGDLIVVA